MKCFYCPKSPKYALRWKSRPKQNDEPCFCCEEHLLQSLDVALTWDPQVKITHAYLDPVYSSKPLKNCFVCQSPKLKNHGSKEHPYPNTYCEGCFRCWNQDWSI